MARLLLVHGDLVRGETLAREIESFGHAVARAPTARAASALAEDGEFDLLVVDGESVGVDGIADLGAMVRAKPSNRVLLLTSDGPAARSRQRPWAAGHIGRPFTRDQLCAKLDEMTLASHSAPPSRR